MRSWQVGYGLTEDDTNEHSDLKKKCKRFTVIIAPGEHSPMP